MGNWRLRYEKREVGIWKGEFEIWEREVEIWERGWGNIEKEGGDMGQGKWKYYLHLKCFQPFGQSHTPTGLGKTLHAFDFASLS